MTGRLNLAFTQLWPGPYGFVVARNFLGIPGFGDRDKDIITL
jgi:hypothetical protein